MRKRQRAEFWFKLFGQLAVASAILALTLLAVSISSHAISAFTRYDLKLDIFLSSDQFAAPETDASNLSANLANSVTGFNLSAQNRLVERFPEARDDPQRRQQLNAIYTRLAVLPYAKKVHADPNLINTTQTVQMPLADNLDLYLKGYLTSRQTIGAGEAGRLTVLNSTLYSLTDSGPDAFPLLRRVLSPADQDTQRPDVIIELGDALFELRELNGASIDLAYLTGDLPELGEQNRRPIRATILTQPAQDRTISTQQIAWVMKLQQDGRIVRRFASELFFNADSTYPELAGAAAAIVGSVLTMLLTAAFAIPIGICGAIYLEEFAGRSRLTRLIETSINNLAAVPSIIFGLLGAVLFLTVLDLPRSTSLVGGLVLGLLVLPTIVITSRAALQAVPNTIKNASLGLGASKLQTVFHHTLPLAAPGILSGAIAGMARAIGEAAPLLLIGMLAFVNQIPVSPEDEATTLPVLIYKWFSASERAWEPMTAAIIIILLAFLLLLNGLAVILRRQFEKVD